MLSFFKVWKLTLRTLALRTWVSHSAMNYPQTLYTRSDFKSANILRQMW